MTQEIEEEKEGPGGGRMIVGEQPAYYPPGRRGGLEGAPTMEQQCETSVNGK